MTDYGQDLDWREDLDPTGALCSGMRLLGNAAFHAITTARGSNFDAPDRGIDVIDFLHKGMTQTERAGLAGLIAQELVEDERFSGADVTVNETINQNGDLGFLITAIITIVEDDSQFQLVCSVADAVPKIVSIDAVG
jgi:hypothetical protein